MIEVFVLDPVVQQEMVDYCARSAPFEVCGFIVADPEAPDHTQRLVSMPNVHSQPTRYWQMDPAEQLQAYERFDLEGVEVLAVFHSHPETDANLSNNDLRQARDLNPIYLVVSREGLAGWRVTMPGVGEKVATRVTIHPPAPPLEVEYPWALAPGNVVDIETQYHGATGLLVLGWSGYDGGQDGQFDVMHNDGKIEVLYPYAVRYVTVHEEGVAGRRLRADLRPLLATARHALETGERLEYLPRAVAGLSAAFPRTLNVQVGT
jgi:proteasome lid subunit RPN8/RPN11